MQLGKFMVVVPLAVVAAVAWWVLRDGAGPKGEALERVAFAQHRGDEALPPPAAEAATVEVTRAPEQLAEEIGVDEENARAIARIRASHSEHVLIEGDADLEVTVLVPDEDHWLWSQLPPRLRIYRSRPDAVEPDLEALVAEQTRRCAAMREGELRALTEEGRQPTDAEVRADVAIRFDQLRRERIWGALVRQAVASVDETTLVHGLAPGRYVVTLQRGDSPRHPRVFDEKIVELESGTTAVALTIPLEEERPHVRLAGTVHYSADWGARGLQLDVDPVAVAGATEADERSVMLSDLAPVEGSPGLYRFEVGDLRPGRYVVTASNLDWRQSVATGAEGRDDVAFVIPDPAEVLVHLVDDATGTARSEPVPLTAFSWFITESGGVPIEAAQWDERAKSYRMHVATGELELLDGFPVGGALELTGRTRFTIQPGRNDVTLRVRAATVVAVKLESEGRAVEFDPVDAHVELTCVDDPRRTCRPRAWASHQLLFHVDAAGRYRVTVPAIPGYADVPPFEVTARQGERVDCKVELVRSR